MAQDHDDRPDSAVVLAARAGDGSAFLQLVARFHPRVVRFLTTHLANPPALDLDELARQTFDAAYDALAHLRTPDFFWPWLRAIALHRLLDERARTRPLVPLDSLALPPAAPAVPDQTAILVEEDLAALGDAVRPVIRLYAQGYSVREIAARLGRKQETVKRALSRARRALRIRSAKDGEERR